MQSNDEKIKISKELRALRSIGKFGCFGILIASFGLGYVVRFFASELLAILPFESLVLSFASGAVLTGISYGAPSWFSVVRIRNEKGAIHLSSPLWIDILRWLGMMVLSICAIFMFSFAKQTWISLIASCFCIIFCMLAIVMLLTCPTSFFNFDKILITRALRFS